MNSSRPSQEFEDRILQNWAVPIGCSVQTLRQAGVTLLPVERYAGAKVIVLSQVAGRTFMERDPAYSDALGRLVAGLRRLSILTAADILESWERQSFGACATCVS